MRILGKYFIRGFFFVNCMEISYFLNHLIWKNYFLDLIFWLDKLIYACFFNPFHRIIELEFTRPTKLQPFFIVDQIKTDLIIFFLNQTLFSIPIQQKFCWHLSLRSRLISTFWRHETIAVLKLVRVNGWFNFTLGLI